MSYIDEVLLRDEKITHRARLHWSVFFSLASIVTLSIAGFIRRATSEFAVTNKRVIIKTGVLTRKTLELNLVKIESVAVDQSLMGRMFNSGTITIIGSGGTRESFPSIGSPLAFRRAVQEAIEDYSAKYGVPGVMPSQQMVTPRLPE